MLFFIFGYKIDIDIIQYLLRLSLVDYICSTNSLQNQNQN